MGFLIRPRTSRVFALIAIVATAPFSAGPLEAQERTRAMPPLSSFAPEPVRHDFASIAAVFPEDPGDADWARAAKDLAAFGCVGVPPAADFAAAWRRFDDPSAPKPSVGTAALGVQVDAFGGLVATPVPFAEPPKPGPRDRVVSLAWRDGLLAAAGRDRTTRLWRVARPEDAGADAAPTATFEATLTGPRNWIVSVALSDDGAWCVAGDVDGRVAVWRLGVGSTAATRVDVEHAGAVFFVAVVAARDGAPHVLSAGADGVIRLRPLPAVGDILPPPVHELDVRAVAYVGNDALLSAGADQRVLWRNFAAGAERTVVDPLAPFPDAVTTLAVASEIGLAAAGTPGGAFQTVRVDGAYPTLRGAPPLRDLGTRVGSAAWRPRSGGWYVGCGDGVVRRFDPTSGASDDLTGAHRAEVKGLAFDATGRLMASAGADNSIVIRDLDRADGEAEGVRLLPPDDRAFGHWHCCAFDPSGRRIAAGALSSLVAIWDAATGEPIYVLRGHSGSIEGMTWSPDGARLLSTSADGHVCVWDATSGDLLRRVPAGALTIYSAAYAPDGRTVATAGQDGTIRTFAAETFAPLKTFGAEPSTRAVAIAPDGSFVAAIYDDGVRVFEPDRPAMLYLLTFPVAARALAFSDDGAILRVRDASGMIHAFESASGTVVDDPGGAFPESPTFDARALAERFGSAGAATPPVRAIAFAAAHGDTFAAVAETRGVVRFFRKTAVEGDASAQTEVIELRAQRDGAWAARSSTIDETGLRHGSLVRADDGGRWLERTSLEEPPVVRSAPKFAGVGREKIVPGVFAPESVALESGAGVYVRLTVANEGTAPAYQVGLRDAARDDVSFFGLGRLTRLDPGETATLFGYVERRSTPPPTIDPASRATTTLFEISVETATSVASTALLVRRP